MLSNNVPRLRRSRWERRPKPGNSIRKLPWLTWSSKLFPRSAYRTCSNSPKWQKIYIMLTLIPGCCRDCRSTGIYQQGKPSFWSSYGTFVAILTNFPGHYGLFWRWRGRCCQTHWWSVGCCCSITSGTVFSTRTLCKVILGGRKHDWRELEPGPGQEVKKSKSDSNLQLGDQKSSNLAFIVVFFPKHVAKLITPFKLMTFSIPKNCIPKMHFFLTFILVFIYCCLAVILPNRNFRKFYFKISNFQLTRNLPINPNHL